MPDLIFHVGLGKTATTLLQKQVFPKINALGNGAKEMEKKELEKDFRNAVLFNDESIWGKKEGDKIKRKILKQASNNPILYSSEYLLRPTYFYPKFNKVQYNNPNKLMISSHIEKFKDLIWNGMGDVYVIITVRNQPEWIASVYAQRSFKYSGSQKDFEKQVKSILYHNDWNGRKFMEYDKVYNEFASIIGKDKVKILFYEELNKLSFWEDMKEFTGFDLWGDFEKISSTKTNIKKVRDNEWQISNNDLLKKIKNKIISVLKLPINKSESYRTIILKDELKNEIKKTFNESNRNLEQITGKNLKEFNY